MRKRHLEMTLERVPRHPSPAAGLEQYNTPAPVAADMLFRVLSNRDLADKSIVDLGCGTGILGIGAALWGASSVLGVDIDPKAVEIARATAERLGAVGCTFEVGRVEDLKGRFDTAIMNPPFGAQFAARGADLRFLENAVRVARRGYSLHLREGRRFLLGALGRMGVDAALEAEYELGIPHQFEFHRKEVHRVEVDLLRFEAPTPAS